mgnify:CR=1 FL=1
MKVVCEQKPADENIIMPMRSSGSKTDERGIRPSESASRLSVVAKLILPGLLLISVVGTMIRESKILEPMMVFKSEVSYTNVDASKLIPSSSKNSSLISASTGESQPQNSLAKI